MAARSETKFELVIGGQEVPGARGEHRPVLDPANNRPMAEAAVASREDARHAMEVAEHTFRESNWAGDDGARRAKALYRLASLLEGQAESFARLETLNMGKPLRESRGDIGYVVRTLEYFAGAADKLEGETIPVPGPGSTTRSASPSGSRCTSPRGTTRSSSPCGPWPPRSRPATPSS